MIQTDYGIDLTKCPRCGGEADNGHDRSFPPNPYYCKKCQDEVDTENVKRWNEGKNNGE